MGTHISKGELIPYRLGMVADEIVKSIDLDVWTPEQMEVSRNVYLMGARLGTVGAEMG